MRIWSKKDDAEIRRRKKRKKTGSRGGKRQLLGPTARRRFIENPPALVNPNP